MSFLFEHRTLDSPIVDSVWRTRSDKAGCYISVAASHWSFLFAKRGGKTLIDICGPETRARRGTFPPDNDVYGINFRPGVFMPSLLPGTFVDERLELPRASDRTFWLRGSACQIPQFDELETFAERLWGGEIIVLDRLIETALRGEKLDVSLRALQYRFVKLTGLTRKGIQQIQRVQQAAQLLEQGASIADTVYRLRYSDQAHLTRSLKFLYGQTPMTVAQVTASFQES